MQEVILKTGMLYVLSAPPGSGKTTLLARSRSFLPESSIVSSDALRAQILGTLSNGMGGRTYFPHADTEVFEIMEKIVRTRAKEGLTTIVDATSVTDSDRGQFAKIAREFGVGFEVLILDVPIEVAKQRNAAREAKVPESHIDDFYKKFIRTSQHAYRIIQDDAVLKTSPWTLPHSKVDVIGDVHGLLDDFIKLIAKAGWVVQDGIPYHADGRLLLLLGDLVDRSPDSIELLRFIWKACLAGVAICLEGNHEAKLVKFWRMAKKQGVTHWSSFANAESGLSLLKLDPREGQALVDFMVSMPSSIVYENGAFPVAFCHADQAFFDALASPKTDLLYGYSRHRDGFDSDREYQKNFDAGINKHVLVRGHITQTSPQQSVFSLERRQVYKGQLVMLRLDEFLKHGVDDRIEGFNKAIVTQDCSFDFDAYSKKFELVRAMDSLVHAKLATRAEHATAGLRLYKYSKRVFYDALWGESDYLMKARGLVLDVAGGIAAHPFDKVFNYHENGTGDDLPDSTQVVAVDKLNGFLGVISKMPNRNELLVTTQGSFDSDFVGYIRSLMTKPMYAAILRYVSKNHVTLMFEVIHPDDPHIIKYDAQSQGLWLTGVRENFESALAWPEHQVDEAGAEMGLRRPAWEVTTFGKLKRKMVTSQIEGTMVREFSREERHLMKIKTPYYLTTKFVGRLSNGKIEHLYNSPSDFKKNLDEEFYPLVDMLVTEVEKVVFQRAAEADRVEIVRQRVERLVA